jgi:hypothetical protein
MREIYAVSAGTQIFLGWRFRRARERRTGRGAVRWTTVRLRSRIALLVRIHCAPYVGGASGFFGSGGINTRAHICTIEKIDDGGNLQVRLDSGRTVAFNIKENPHLDYGYAVTSHSSQGQTADRVLVHIDTEQAGEKLVNRRLAYVAVSRGRNAQLYTNDKGQLAEQLGRDVSHRSAIEASRESASSAHQNGPSTTRRQGHEHTQAEGHSISR